MGPRNIRSDSEHQTPFGRSFTSSSPIAASAIARDLASYSEDDQSPRDGASPSSTAYPVGSYISNARSLAGSYRRPSNFTSISHATIIPWTGEQQTLSKSEHQQMIEEERHLLSDNHVIPPEHAHGKPHGLQHKVSGLLSAAIGQGSSSQRPSRSQRSRSRPRELDGASENTALLRETMDSGESGSEMGSEEIDRKWDEAVAAGRIQTTWQREAKVIGKYSLPLMVTFLLQYSLTVASIFTIGHLGKEELGAVSLASMTVTITGNAVYSGLATSLDTLCSQAYGSGKRKLVGLQMLRMVYFLWIITIPIMVLWYFSEHILAKIVPETEVAKMAGLYLKVALLGTPGFACFESGKRYLQAQGVFSASLYVLIVCAPLNAFLNWFFVWVSLVHTFTSLIIILMDEIETSVGIHRCAHCRCDHGNPSSNLPLHLCLFLRWIRVLVWVQSTCVPELGPNDSTGASGVDHGRGGVPGIRNPDTRIQLPRHIRACSAVHPGYHLKHHMADPFPTVHRG